MIEILGCTKSQFDGYLDGNVFAPCIKAKKRGRPSNTNKGAVYDADTVEKEVRDFQAGKFEPSRIIGVRKDICEEGNNGTADSVLSKQDGNGKTHGQVIRLPGLPEEKDEDKFDFEKEIGPINTMKELRAAIAKCAIRQDVPLRIVKNIHKTYELRCKERERKELRKRKVTMEKHESDCQKVYDTAMGAWSGPAGLEAAQIIVEKINQGTGKSLQREISNIVQLVHRAIVETSNKVIQPAVKKILEKV